jgi:hypothetical protein
VNTAGKYGSFLLHPLLLLSDSPRKIGQWSHHGGCAQENVKSFLPLALAYLANRLDALTAPSAPAAVVVPFFFLPLALLAASLSLPTPFTLSLSPSSSELSVPSLLLLSLSLSAAFFPPNRPKVFFSPSNIPPPWLPPLCCCDDDVGADAE